jgi:Esterase-like activity of phytase
MSARHLMRTVWLGFGLGLTVAIQPGQADDGHGPKGEKREGFERIATFLVCENTSCDREEVEATAAEIVTATGDGRMLIYSDSLSGRVGFVDIEDPAAPRAAGTVPVDGEPTSVSVSGPYALVSVNTSASFTEPSGELRVFDVEACLGDIETCAPVATFDLKGQPDSVAIDPGDRFAAIVIENERDEEVVVEGVEGGLPQPPAGFLWSVELKGAPAEWVLRRIELTEFADIAPSDPEPEFVDISRRHQAIVSLQESNHLALVDLERGKVLRHFAAGEVDLAATDTEQDDLISLEMDLEGVRREPDAVGWLDRRRFASANEGDLAGGSRGFSIFDRRGELLFDTGTAFENLGVRHGHFPEARADAAGTEGLEIGKFAGKRLLFVASERGNFVAVYRDRGRFEPRFLQLLPTGIGPEGLLALPERELFVVASEDDEALRSQINIFHRQEGEPGYPKVVSADDPATGRPIPWGALSALAGDRDDPKLLYTAHDSFYRHARIYALDVSDEPAVISDEVVLSLDGEPVDLDIEGIVQRPDGGFWVVSEGAGAVDDPEVPVETLNLLIEVAADGTLLRQIELPEATNALQRDNGFEGVAVTGEGTTSRSTWPFSGSGSAIPTGRRLGRPVGHRGCRRCHLLGDRARQPGRAGRAHQARLRLLDRGPGAGAGGRRLPDRREGARHRPAASAPRRQRLGARQARGADDRRRW